jgi:ubiquinone/menaquinone biosynthesis C-methylase UbiE
MKNNQAEFDEFAQDYRTIHTKNIGDVSGTDSNYFSEYKIKEIFLRKIVREDSSFLDLGCGDGISSEYIEKYFPKSSYIGIDVSEKSIYEARKNYTENVRREFGVYDGENIPFDDKTFDVVYIACVMHHIEPVKRDGILRECRRVLKSDGKIIIFEHNPYNPVTMKMVNTCPFDENAVLLKAKETKALLKRAGFSGIKLKYTIFFPRKGIFNKILGLEKYFSWTKMGGQYYCVAEKHDYLFEQY